MAGGYLTLSRRLGERIFIGDDIEILVARCNHEKVRLAIKAPGMRIDREEVRNQRVYTTLRRTEWKEQTDASL